jgi:TolB-like protein/Tfp pilus assembly protein PilF
MSDSQPATANSAVFLSYASQDAEAVERIAVALRAAGIEVWFDRDELVGGDAWDAKIRGQITSCALFVPVISAATQTRHEGYFRLEWKLAAQRTHMMSGAKAFLLPVVIDETRDAEAHVPAEFREVQWTRLPAGETSPAFAARMHKLLGSPSASVAASRPAAIPQSIAARTVKSGPPRWGPIALGAVVLALIAFVMMRPSGKDTPRFNDKSIAVLPFANRSVDKENEFFTDGVHEDILTNISNIRELRVVSSTSVAQYRGTTKTMKQIGAELSVAYILEGSVQRVGNKVRVTGQLIDARTDAHVWAKAFDKDLNDIFVIQAEVAKAIATELRAVLSPEEKKLVEEKLTDNPKAYDLYLEAGVQIRRFGNTTEAHAKARTLLQAAVELDPKFAAAWAQLSFIHGSAYRSNRDRSPARLAQAKAALEKVNQLARGTPLAIGASGQHYYTLGDYARSLERYESLAILQPNVGTWHNQVGICERRLGHWPQALAALRRAVALSPESFVSSANVAQALESGRRYQEADVEDQAWLRTHPDAWVRYFWRARRSFRAIGSTVKMDDIVRQVPESFANSKAGIEARMSAAFLAGNLDEYLRLDASKPNDATADWNAGPKQGIEPAIVLMARGDTAGAKARLADLGTLRARLEAEPENDLLWAQLGEYEALLGHKEEALRCVRKAVELMPETFDALRGPIRSLSLAFVYAWTGDKEGAIAEYTRLLRLPISVSYLNKEVGLNVHDMKRCPAYAPLRGDPRFEALLNDPKNNAPLF